MMDENTRHRIAAREATMALRRDARRELEMRLWASSPCLHPETRVVETEERAGEPAPLFARVEACLSCGCSREAK
jgi:hypothetical protein